MYTVIEPQIKRQVINICGELYYSSETGSSYLRKLPKTHFNKGEYLYHHEVEERLKEEPKDFGDQWNKWADSVGAERATVEDALSIGDDEEEDEITFIEPEDDLDDLAQTGLAEIDGGLESDLIKEEWIANNIPMGGDPVDMEAMWDAHNTVLG
jgi:hypothetical protein